MATTVADLVAKLRADDKALKRGLSSARKQLKELEKKMRSAEKTARTTTRKAGNAFTKLGDTIRNKGTLALVAFSAALSLAGKDVLSVGRSFSAAIGELSAITGASGEDLKFLSDGIKELGQSTTKTATEVAQGVTLIGSLRAELLKTPAALIGITAEMITLAEATGATMPEAATALGQALNQFELNADQASRVINAFAAAAQLGAKQVPFLTRALVKAGPIAKRFNIPFEETIAVLETLGKKGIEASVASTGFATVLLRLAKDGRAEFNPELVDIITLLDNVKKANLSTVESMELFGLEAFNVAGIMVENNDVTKALLPQIKNTQTAYEQAAIKAATYDGKLKTLGSALEGLQLAIFSRVEPALVSMVEKFTELSRKAIETVEPISGVVEILGKTGLVIAATAATTALVGLAAQGVIATAALLTTNLAATSLVATLSFLAGSFFLGFKLGEILDSEFKLARDAGAIFFNFVARSIAHTVFIFKSLGLEIAEAFSIGFKASLTGLGTFLVVLENIAGFVGAGGLSESLRRGSEDIAAFQASRPTSTLAADRLRLVKERDTRLANIEDATTSALRRDTDTVTVTAVLPEKNLNGIQEAVRDGVREGFIGFDQLITLGGSGSGTFSTVGSGRLSSAGAAETGTIDLGFGQAPLRFKDNEFAREAFEQFPQAERFGSERVRQPIAVTLEIDGEIVARKTVEKSSFKEAVRDIQQAQIENVRRGVD
jgi:TP901 family phage tail tape measure protein